MQGKIVVNSRKGCGTTVSVIVPTKFIYMAPPRNNYGIFHFATLSFSNNVSWNESVLKCGMKCNFFLLQLFFLTFTAFKILSIPNYSYICCIRTREEGYALNDTPAAPTPPIEEHPPCKKNSTVDQRVLVVEDNLLNQNLLSKALKLKGLNIIFIPSFLLIFLPFTGFCVDVASNGLEGFEKFQKESYDFVLMDLQMPVMDGLQCTKSIRLFEEMVIANGIPNFIANTP
jgi:CheY-like chemotaxis protein